MKSIQGRLLFGFLGVLGVTGLVVSGVSAKDHGHGKPPVNKYRRVNLVSDIAGVAEFTDPNLVNPWGLVVVPSSGRVWVSDNGAGVSTLYDANGTPRSLVVTVAPPAGSTNPAAPTGMIGNDTGAFVISKGTNSAPALFIWSTEDGTVSGWNPAVDPSNAVLVIDHAASNSVYKGIARAADGSSNQFIFVTDFHNGLVEKYDASFHLVSTFTDATLPAGYAPFGIQNINGKLFVTFAIQNAEQHDDVAGPGNGFVDVFDLNGNRLQQFAAHGALNSPWGVALAPGGFGAFGGTVLVGNFGDGAINAYALGSGAFLGTLLDKRGDAVAIDGLWGLKFSATPIAMAKGDDDDDDVNGQVLYFTAGIGGEGHGLFGVIKAVPSRGHGH